MNRGAHIFPPRASRRLLFCGRVFASALAVALAGGCTTTTAPPLAAPVPETSRHAAVRISSPIQPPLGAVALVFQPAKADFQLQQMPQTRSEAGSSGAADVLDEFRKSPGGDPGPAAVLIPVAVGLGTAGGWIRGAFSGMNADVVNQTVATLERTGADFTLTDHLSKTILARGGEIPARSITVPTTVVSVEPPSLRLRYQAGANGTWHAVRAAPEPHPLASQGIETLAVIHCRTHALVGSGEKNAELYLQLEVGVHLVRTADWSNAGEFNVSYVSASRPFTEWAQADGAPLRREWELAVEILERRLVDALAGR